MEGQIKKIISSIQNEISRRNKGKKRKNRIFSGCIPVITIEDSWYALFNKQGRTLYIDIYGSDYTFIEVKKTRRTFQYNISFFRFSLK